MLINFNVKDLELVRKFDRKAKEMNQNRTQLLVALMKLAVEGKVELRLQVGAKEI